MKNSILAGAAAFLLAAAAQGQDFSTGASPDLSTVPSQGLLSAQGQTLMTAQGQDLPQLPTVEDTAPPATVQQNQGTALPLTAPTTPEEADALLRQMYPDATEPETRTEDQANGSRKPWKLTLHADVAATFDDNIFISRENKVSDMIYTLSPGFTLGLGDFVQREENFLLVDYTATGLLFNDNTQEDAFEQLANLVSQWHFSRLTLGAQFTFQDLAGSSIDVGNRTKRTIYESSLSAKYDVSEKTFVEGDLQNIVSNYATELNSTEWQGHVFFNYKWTPKITAGVGISGGVLDVDLSGQQTYEQALGKLTYITTEKLSFEGEGGVEVRQTSSEERVTPVFTVSASYNPFEATTVRLSAYSRTENSASLAGEDYTTTGASLAIHRTIWHRFDVGVSGGYEHSDYENVNGTANASRKDNYFFVQPSIQFDVWSWARAEVFYLYRRNDSTISQSAFADNQVGLQFDFSY